MERRSHLLKLHHSDPDDADVLYMLAQEHAKEGEHAQAIVWYDACLRSAPDYHYAFYHKARSQEARGERSLARATLESGLERARSAADAKAAGEIEEYLSSLAE